MNNKVTNAGVVLALVLGVFGLFSGDVVTNPVQVIKETVGGVSSDDSHKFFKDGVTVGGNVLATTTGVTLTAYTLSAVEMGAETININPSVDLTLSLSATNSAQFIPNIGDEYTFTIKNASTTAASSLTLDNVDASVGIALAEATGADLVLAGGNWAKVTLKRLANTGVIMEVFVSEFVPG